MCCCVDVLNRVLLSRCARPTSSPFTAPASHPANTAWCVCCVVLCWLNVVCCAQVTELCKRGSLYSLLHSGIKLSPQLRLRFILECARGVAWLHRMKILHRDVKSPNVLVTDLFHVKLCDFGLAKAKTETQTATKNTGGTSKRWRAPELFKLGAKYNEACDVFSFAVFMLEVATGEVRVRCVS